MSRGWLALKIVPLAHGHSVLLSIPKKAVPLSTRRSRLKRLIRESLRLNGWNPPQAMAYHLIVRGPLPERLKRADVDDLLGRLVADKRDNEKPR